MLLAVAAWWADRRGAHGLALDALLLAVPFAALAGLAAFGDAVERPRELGRFQAGLWALVVGLLVLSCASRNAHGATGSLTPLGSSALAAALGVLVLKACVATAVLVRQPGTRPAKP